MFDDLVVLPTSTTFTDNNGDEYTTTSTSVLTALISADKTSDEFDITNLEYYPAYSSFYLHCLAFNNAENTKACNNWNYVVDGIYPSNIGMDSYNLAGGETVYIYFNNSWKISASTSTFDLGATTTFYTWQYDYADPENEWLSDPEDKINISVNNPNSTGWWDATTMIATTTSDNSGSVDYLFTSTGTFYTDITADDYSKWSSPITINVTSPTSTEATTPTSTPTQGGGDSTPQFNSISSAKINATVEKILNYIKLQQSNTGEIIDGGTSDWLMMSFGAHWDNSSKIKNGDTSLLSFVLGYDFDGYTDLNLCAGYPRHIMALLAGGVNTDHTKVNELKSKMLTECYTDNLYGQDGINDDVFALMALLEFDYSSNDQIVSDLVKTIVNDQTGDGAFTWVGWPGADITGAAINALSSARNHGITVDQSVLDNAKNYLKQNQLADGGWGYGTSDILTTSWAMMGINALDESQSDWFNSEGKNPWYPMTERLNDAVYYESAWTPGTVDWFAMKHAVPALLKSSWPIVKTFVDNNSSTTYPISTGCTNCDSKTPTTTEEIIIEEVSTSTIDIILKTPTTTPSSTIDIVKPKTTEIEKKNNEPEEEIIKNIPPAQLIRPYVPPKKVLGEKIDNSNQDKNKQDKNKVEQKTVLDDSLKQNGMAEESLQNAKKPFLKKVMDFFYHMISSGFKFLMNLL